jgi:hypothetical protein
MTFLSLVPLDSISESEKAVFLTELNEDFVNLGDTSNSAELWDYFMHKPVSWVIVVNDIKIGLMALSNTIYRPSDHIQTSTYISAPYRGKGHNRVIKQAVAQAFLNFPHYKLCSIIRGWNEGSLTSLSRIFPEIAFIKEERQNPFPDPTSHQYFFDLSTVSKRDLHITEENIYNTVVAWGNLNLTQPAL